MRITVKKNDLLKVLLEVYTEADNSGSNAIEISIEDNALYFATLECGGMGCCADFDCVQGLTEEEILDIQ